MICSNQNIRPFYPKLSETFFHNTNRREERANRCKIINHKLKTFCQVLRLAKSRSRNTIVLRCLCWGQGVTDITFHAVLTHHQFQITEKCSGIRTYYFLWKSYSSFQVLEGCRIAIITKDRLGKELQMVPIVQEITSIWLTANTIHLLITKPF